MAQCQSVPNAKTQANGEYAQRIDRVIDYLRGNLRRHSAYEPEHAPALETLLDKRKRDELVVF